MGGSGGGGREDIVAMILSEHAIKRLDAVLVLLSKEEIYQENVSEGVAEAIQSMGKTSRGIFFAANLIPSVLEKQKVDFIETENARLLGEIETMIKIFMDGLRSRLTLSIGKVSLGGGR